MAWGVPKIGTLVEDATGNFTLIEPAGVADGDLMVACIAYRGNAAITLPAGWTVVATAQNSGDTDASAGIASGHMAYIVRGANAPALICTRTAGDVVLARIISYSGGKRAPYDTGSANTAASSSATVTTGTITTATAGELIVAMTSAGDLYNVSTFDAVTDPATASGATDTTTAPANGTWIERADNSTSTGADTGLGIADAVRATAGATGEMSAILTNVGRHVMIAGAFKLVGTAPTTALNTPADAATGQSTTPTVNFTGTDADGDTVEYNVNIHTSSTFPTIFDTFNDNIIAPIWSSSSSADATQVIEQNQRLEITHTAASQYNTLIQVTTFNLTGTYAAVRITDAGNQALTSHQTLMGVHLDATHKFWFDTNNGNISAWYVNGGANTQVGSNLAYNSTNHAYRRIRESGGTTFWDYSADGVSWTNLASVANPFAVTAVLTYLQSGCYNSEASPSLGYFDNFSIGNLVPLLDKFSTVDTGFTAGHPFASAAAKDFTVQAGDILANSTTYYWRVRTTDPLDTGNYGAWATTRSFTTAAATSAALTGTVTASITEADIVTGGKTIILTLTGDTWVASGGTFDGQRDDIIAGIDSAQSELLGWDNVVKALQGVGGVVRTSDTVVTITLDAQITYNITAPETITATIPGSALTGGSPIVASPTFVISQTGGTAVKDIIGMGIIPFAR